MTPKDTKAICHTNKNICAKIRKHFIDNKAVTKPWTNKILNHKNMFLTTKNNKKGKTKTYNGQTNYNKDNIEQQATGKSK